MGDACLFTQKNAINPLLVITRSLKDLEYLKYQFDIYEPLCKQGITIHSKCIEGYDKIYGLCRFRTRGLDLFYPYKQKWYVSGKKIVPRDISLTPLVLAIWFCDDGYLSLKKDRSGNPTSALRLKLATHGFTKSDAEFLASTLEALLKVKFYIYEDRNKFYLLTYTDGAKAFMDYCLTDIPVSMTRKILSYRGVLCPNGFHKS